MNTNTIGHHIYVVMPTVILDRGFISQDDANKILENLKSITESLSYRAVGSRPPTDAAIVTFDCAVPLSYLLDLLHRLKRMKLGMVS